MIGWLLEFDKTLFFAINDGLKNPVFDYLMPILRSKYTWLPLYTALLVFFIKQYKLKGIYLTVFLLLTVALADRLSAGLIKPFFGRLRPCNDPDIRQQVYNMVGCGSGFSFVSAHACNHFAMAMFLISVFSARWKPILPIGLIWATSISLAQVYVGVHYPMDIFCGTILGVLIGLAVAWFFKKIQPIHAV